MTNAEQLTAEIKIGLNMMFTESAKSDRCSECGDLHALYTLRGLGTLMRIIEREKKAAVEQALALAYQSICRGERGEYGPDVFYKPILERMFLNKP